MLSRVSNAGSHLCLQHLRCCPILFVAVDDIKPNRRYASVLKLLIVFVSAVAIAKRLIP
jgi:hypothetical protein